MGLNPHADTMATAADMEPIVDMELNSNSSDMEAPQNSSRATWKKIILRGMAMAAPFALCAVVFSGVIHTGQQELFLASSFLDGDVESLIALDTCGNANGNDFRSLKIMQELGWHFYSRDNDGTNGVWQKNHVFRPSLKGITTVPVPAGSYWGWDYPGDGLIERRLHGGGTIKVIYGNAYQAKNSLVEIKINGVVKSQCHAGDLNCVYTFAFKDGDLFEIKENPRGIIVLREFILTCGAVHPSPPARVPAPAPARVPAPAPARVPAPAPARVPAPTPAPTPAPPPPTPAPTAAATIEAAAKTAGMVKNHESVFISGAKWHLVPQAEWDCDSACVVDVQEAASWGTYEALSDRTWCATACLETGNGVSQACKGFLYPDKAPNEAGACYIYSADHSKCPNLDARRLKEGSKFTVRKLLPAEKAECYNKPMNKLSFDEYTLDDKKPSNYPELVESTQ